MGLLKKIKKIINKKEFEHINVGANAYTVADHWFWEEYKNTGWEPETFKMFARHLTEDITYVDLGAWVGVTMMFAHSLGCNRIYSVEANPESYALLLKTLERNDDLRAKVNLKNICITNKNGDSVSFGKGVSSASRIGRDGQYVVNTQTLSSYLEENGLTGNLFIKVDIEGSELLILEDLRELCKKEDVKIFLALHPPFWDNKIDQGADLLNVLSLFEIRDANNNKLTHERLGEMIMTEEEFPEWGTAYGNFFEVLLTYKKNL